MRRGLPFLLALLAAGCATNPVTGARELSLYTEAEELELGRRAHPQVIYQYDGEYPDPELQRYLGTIVLRLQRVSHRPDMPVDFKVLNSSVVNAFALPGHVYITRGLLAELENEGEFAAVMGHEIAHVTCRHSAAQLSRAQLFQVGLNAVALALPAEKKESTWVLTAAAVGLKLVQLKFSRSQEEQADRVGTYYLYRAGYEPRRALDMQRLLARLSGGGLSRVAEFFSTHPRSARRVERIQEVMRRLRLDDGRRLQGDGTFAARWRRRLAPLRAAHRVYRRAYDRARKLAREGRRAEALALVRRGQKFLPGHAPFHRLEGDLLLEAGDTRGARAAYGRALRADPRYLFARVGLGRAALAAGRLREAASHFRRTLALLSDYPDAHYGLGLALVGLQRFRAAIPHLEAVVAQVPDPAALVALGRAYEAVGRPWDAARVYRTALERAPAGSEPLRVARERLAALGMG